MLKSINENHSNNVGQKIPLCYHTHLTQSHTPTLQPNHNHPKLGGLLQHQTFD